MSAPHDIVVYGATGYTGRLVARELVRRGDDFVLGGRSPQNLRELASQLEDEGGSSVTWAVANVDDDEALDRLFDRAEVAISCAGPFDEIGRPVARAAVRQHTHYLDVAGEQAFWHWIDAEIGPAAAERGKVAMPGCAFEFAAGSLAGAAALELGAERVVLAYWFAQTWTSAGTKKTVVRNLARPGYAYHRGRRVPVAPAERVFEVPSPSGGFEKAVQRAGGASVMLPKMGRVETAASAFVVAEPAARLLAALSGVLPQIAEAVRPLADSLVDWLQRRGEMDAPDSREAPYRVTAFDPERGEWFAVLSGRGPYRTTARMIVESARRLRDGALEGGFQTPGSLWHPGDFAESIGARLQLRDSS